MTEFSLEAFASQYRVPPKRILAERLLRSVKAGNSADQAPSSLLRRVEVRSVSASQYRVKTKSRLPRFILRSWEGDRQRLAGVAKSLKRTARVSLVARMSERFATNHRRRVTAGMFIGSSRLLRLQ